MKKKTSACVTLITFWFCVGCSAELATRESRASESLDASVSSSSPSSSAVISDEAILSELVQATHQQVNEFRRSQGLAELTLEPVLSEQARQHSTAMSQTGNLSHDGFDQRISAIRQEISLQSAAENVAFNSGFDEPVQQAIEGWKNSEGHRQNM
ncbi:MAG: CAP domain-containing protein, partial [Cyanobacteria bacterium J06626_14]